LTLPHPLLPLSLNSKSRHSFRLDRPCFFVQRLSFCHPQIPADPIEYLKNEEIFGSPPPCRGRLRSKPRGSFFPHSSVPRGYPPLSCSSFSPLSKSEILPWKERFLLSLFKLVPFVTPIFRQPAPLSRIFCPPVPSRRSEIFFSFPPPHGGLFSHLPYNCHNGPAPDSGFHRTMLFLHLLLIPGRQQACFYLLFRCCHLPLPLFQVIHPHYLNSRVGLYAHPPRSPLHFSRFRSVLPYPESSNCGVLYSLFTDPLGSSSFSLSPELPQPLLPYNPLEFGQWSCDVSIGGFSFLPVDKFLFFSSSLFSIMDLVSTFQYLTSEFRRLDLFRVGRLLRIRPENFVPPPSLYITTYKVSIPFNNPVCAGCSIRPFPLQLPFPFRNVSEHSLNLTPPEHRPRLFGASPRE